MLDCDWFCTRLFDTYLEGDHVGVQLQSSNLNFLQLDTCNRTTTLHASIRCTEMVLFIAVSPPLAKLIIKIKNWTRYIGFLAF